MQYYSKFVMRSLSSRVERRKPFPRYAHSNDGGSPMKLHNFVSDQWREGTGPGEPLVDPVTGEEVARISSQGIDIAAALDFARLHRGPALRQISYVQRAELLAKIADTLAANRDEYFRLSLLNLVA